MYSGFKCSPFMVSINCRSSSTPRASAVIRTDRAGGLATI